MAPRRDWQSLLRREYTMQHSGQMGDEEEQIETKYVYAGERQPGETLAITAGDNPKVLTKDFDLLGLREGNGEARYPNTDTYKGGYNGGRRHGLGTYVYASQPPAEEGEDPKPAAATYDGAWKQGAKSGIAQVAYKTGHKYHGHMKGGLRHGNGTMYYPNGDIYTGEFLRCLNATSVARLVSSLSNIGEFDRFHTPCAHRRLGAGHAGRIWRVHCQSLRCGKLWHMVQG